MNVMNIYIIVALLLSFICTDAVGQSDDRYMVFLRDKGGVSADDVSPASYLSPRALQRRAAQGIDIDSLDVPVYAEYVEEISAYARIIGKTKWMNAVMVATAQGDDAIDSIERLPFVTGIQLVGHYMPETPADIEADMSVTYPETDDYHGVMRQPLECNAIDRLHDDGFTGEGMLIAMTDDGYCNVDSMLGGWADNIVCVRDFVNAADSLLYDIGSHGVRTFSCIAADMPHKMVGSAPGAIYALLRTEYLGGEQPAEEYYWAFAAEFADSIGADIINVSLGYNHFDEEFPSITTDDLDGRCVISRCADVAAGRGMVVVVSAGNTGNSTWRKVTIPADAFDVLAVGGLAAGSVVVKATFSSVGPSADGRVKPDIMAAGSFSAVTRSGTISPASGTSFSAPVIAGGVACLWEALPGKTASEIVDIVRRSSTQYSEPDSLLGYGVPDLYKAYIDNRESGIVSSPQADLVRAEGQYLIIPSQFLSDDSARVMLYDLGGRLILSSQVGESCAVPLYAVPVGLYVVGIVSRNFSCRNILFYDGC